MKLAEALVLRADLSKRLEQLKARILRNAKVQEGDTPGESPVDLIHEFDACARELTELITCINLSNSETMLDGKSLTAALAERDTLRLRQVMRQDLTKAGGNHTDRQHQIRSPFPGNRDCIGYPETGGRTRPGSAATRHEDPGGELVDQPPGIAGSRYPSITGEHKPFRRAKAGYLVARGALR